MVEVCGGHFDLIVVQGRAPVCSKLRAYVESLAAKFGVRGVLTRRDRTPEPHKNSKSVEVRESDFALIVVQGRAPVCSKLRAHVGSLAVKYEARSTHTRRVMALEPCMRRVGRRGSWVSLCLDRCAGTCPCLCLAVRTCRESRRQI